MTADLLVLDDLGAEKTSEWVEETLNLIVNTRYNERRATIFTSNYEEKEDRTDPESLLVRVGFRMHSRLYEMCEFLEFDGADYRARAAQLGPRRAARAVEDPASGPASCRPASGGPVRAQLREPRNGRRPGRAEMDRREGGAADERATLTRTEGRKILEPRCVPRSLPPHPVLQPHLQLLQLQPRAVRRGRLKRQYVDALEHGDPPRRRWRRRRHDLLRRRHAVAARARGGRPPDRRVPRVVRRSRRTPR